jgi:hypothetical protein
VKTQIIQLEHHDDPTSTRDKMGWSQTGRILLVWPKKGRILTRKIDLILLYRHAQKLGGQLALVTADSEVRFNANQIGLSIFTSVRQAQFARWKRPQKPQTQQSIFDPEEISSRKAKLDEFNPPQKQSHELPLAARITLFSLAILAVLCIAVVILPSAEVKLEPKPQTQQISIPVLAKDGVEQVTVTGTVPIHWVNFTVEGEAHKITSSVTHIPQGFAKGTVIFTNLTDHQIVIPKGISVSNQNLELSYTTDQSSIIPAGPGQSVSTRITATEPGEKGNIGVGEIQNIEGTLGLDMTVTNPEAISGGSDVQSPASSAKDYADLQATLMQNLTDEANLVWASKLSPGDQALDDQPRFIRKIEEVFSPTDPQPASELFLNLMLAYKMPVVSEEDLTSLTRTILDASLPDGYRVIPNSESIEQLTSPVWIDETTARWQIKASRMLQPIPNESQIASLIAGLSPHRAMTKLVEQADLASTPIILRHPSWWPLLPFLPFRIELQENTS